MSCKKLWVPLTVLVVISALCYCAYRIRTNRIPTFSGSISCTIDLTSFDDTTAGLISGYNYLLLKEFAKANNLQAEINLKSEGEEPVDSLINGAIDILVIPYSYSESIDSVMVSIPVDSMTLWAMEPFNNKKANMVNSWLNEYHNSDEYQKYHDSFIDVYEPFATAKKGIHRDILSPYDDMIMAGARRLGWDWTLVTALVYQESQFSITARSRKGASGLMQMMPATGKAFGATNLLDPEQSIEAGVKYLEYIQKMMRKRFKSPIEVRKFTIAAYNAGETRILSRLDTLDKAGIFCQSWSDFTEILQRDSTLLKNFKASETIRYVDRIYQYYWAFNKIFKENSTEPGQIEQDQP